jgi:hypothetical protein
MKKLFLIGASLFSILTVSGFAQGGYGGYAGYGGYGGYGGDCCDQPCGECICKYVRYEPVYYSTKRCIEEQIPCTKTCCQYVPEYYQVQKCRYVPQYYCETRCRQVPQYYCVQEFKCARRVICEPQCTYVPRYYWKHECRNPCAPCCP